MNCPTCGASGYSKDVAPGGGDNPLTGLVKSASGGNGNRLKNIKPARNRPDAIGGKGAGITRGGRFAKN